MSQPTKEQIEAGFRTIQALSETIRELGQVPSGTLYAQVMSKLSLESYNKVIGILKNAGLVTEQAHLLTWAGPKPSVHSDVAGDRAQAN